MKTHLAGEDLSLQIPLRMGTEPVVPDANSVTLTVRDNAGQVLINKEPVVMAGAATNANIVVPASSNALGAGRFTMRTVIVEFTKTGRPQSVRLSYRLTGWLNTTITVDDVRAFCGLDAGELPDSVIDLVEAYFDVENDVSEPILSAALASADQKQVAANRMILARAVLLQIPGLALRISQNESNGVFSAQRPKIDLIGLEMRAQALYAESSTLTSLRDEADMDLLLAPALSPDPITGA